MTTDYCTFLDIVRFNSNDWSRAYEVLTCYLERGSLIKEPRGPEDIIYHNVSGIEPFNLIHRRVFFNQTEEPRKRLKIRKANLTSVPEKSQDDV